MNSVRSTVERMRSALDTLAKERTDLQREYERARHAEGVAKLEPLSTSLKSFEEGHKLLLAAKQPVQANAAEFSVAATAAATKILRGRPNAVEALADLWWAVLNTNEFILNH